MRVRPSGLLAVTLTLGTAAAGGLGAPRIIWILMGVAAAVCGLYAFAQWTSDAPSESPQASQQAPTLKARLVTELREGHLLDARLKNSPRRDQAWLDLCNEIDVWTFRVQQLLYRGPTEFLTDFHGDWKPNRLQSRQQISADLQARLRELSKIVQALG